LLGYLDTGDLVAQRTQEILRRSLVSAWAACASVWCRVFVLSGQGWMRHPDLFDKMNKAFFIAIQRSLGADNAVDPPSVEAILDAFEAFDIEDDGSPEWNYMIDLIEIISTVIRGEDVRTCLDTTLRVYVEGRYNMIARAYAISEDRPISQKEADERMARDPEWNQVINFVNSL
jgi:hypothetical protein